MQVLVGKDHIMGELTASRLLSWIVNVVFGHVRIRSKIIGRFRSVISMGTSPAGRNTGKV